MLLRDFESVNLVSNESMWIIDSGATLHLSPRKEFFTSYTSCDFRMLKMDNDGVSRLLVLVMFVCKPTWEFIYIT